MSSRKTIKRLENELKELVEATKECSDKLEKFVIKGSDLNKLGLEFFKFVREDKTHHGFTYALGLNQDPKFDLDMECNNGLFFTTREWSNHWEYFVESPMVAIVKIPDSATVVVFPKQHKLKTNEMIIEEFKPWFRPSANCSRSWGFIRDCSDISVWTDPLTIFEYVDDLLYYAKGEVERKTKTLNIEKLRCSGVIPEKVLWGISRFGSPDHPEALILMAKGQPPEFRGQFAEPLRKMAFDHDLKQPKVANIPECFKNKYTVHECFWLTFQAYLSLSRWDIQGSETIVRTNLDFFRATTYWPNIEDYFL